MIRFLLKGILRDKTRSMLPVIIISIGVALTVLLSGYMRGAYGDIIDQNARFETGHVKLMSKAYAENKDQMPNDLALLGVGNLMVSLNRDYPEYSWVKRIKFGGLIDAPDNEGNSKGQGPASGMALDLLSKNSSEIKRMQLQTSLVSGHLPSTQNEALIGNHFAEKLNLSLGDEITFFGTTMNGSMTFKCFKISGTIRFGSAALDKGALLIDIADAQKMMDMEDGAGEILGFLNSGIYDHQEVLKTSANFNLKYQDSNDEYDPIMLTLKEQNNLEGVIDYADKMSGIFIFIFILAMSLVLWNTGLLSGLRRYQEFGIRLALGEAKSHIYTSLIMEASLIGIIGSIIGTTIGLIGTYYMQTVGIDISSYINNSSMIMPSIIRSKISLDLFYIGFIPGLFAMVLGNMLAGLGIYKRETARLFKELEV